MNILKTSLVALAVALILAAYILAQSPKHADASVTVANEYQATTTSAAQVLVNANRTIRIGQGTLGSVVITGKNSGLLQIYDATTSDPTLRGNIASTTVVLADFPTNAPEGTYTFDVAFKYGLLIVDSGSAATSTVTYR